MQAMNIHTEELLELKTQSEAEIATEFGDGSEFQVGEVVIHNFRKGSYRKQF